MIELFEKDMVSPQRKSSKGNQLKWAKDSIWYKADQMGYEGLSEYVVSQLLFCSNLSYDMITAYQTEQIRYRSRIMNGCSSRNFLKRGESLITLERLFHQFREGRSFYYKSLPESPCLQTWDERNFF